MRKQGTRQPWTTAFIGKDPSRKKVFDCLYCVGQKTVKIGITKRSGTAHLHCCKCKTSWTCTINYLEEECDVFDRWEKACREAAMKEAGLRDGSTKAKEAKSVTAPTLQTSNKVRKILDGKRLDLNKFVNMKPKKNAGLETKDVEQVKKADKVVPTAGKKRKTQHEEQTLRENAVPKKLRVEKPLVDKEIVQPTQKDLGCLLDTSSDEGDDDDLERELELALAAEVERGRNFYNEEAIGSKAEIEVEKKAAPAEEKMEKVDCGSTKLKHAQQQEAVKEKSSPIATAESRVSRSRASSRDSLFGSSSDGSEFANDDPEKNEAAPEQRCFDNDDSIVTKKTNANFAALHAAFGLEEHTDVRLRVTTNNRSGCEETTQSDGGRSSMPSNSVFGDSGQICPP